MGGRPPRRAEAARLKGIFDPAVVRECWNRHLAAAGDHWQLLWVDLDVSAMRMPARSPGSSTSQPPTSSYAPEFCRGCPMLRKQRGPFGCPIQAPGHVPPLRLRREPAPRPSKRPLGARSASGRRWPHATSSHRNGSLTPPSSRLSLSSAQNRASCRGSGWWRYLPSRRIVPEQPTARLHQPAEGREQREVLDRQEIDVQPGLPGLGHPPRVVDQACLRTEYAGRSLSSSSSMPPMAAGSS